MKGAIVETCDVQQLNTNQPLQPECLNKISLVCFGFMAYQPL